MSIKAMAKPATTVQKITQSEEGFWDLMGPFFASALVKRELGVAMSSDESYTWFLAIAHGEVQGFCAVTNEKKGSRLRHVYVVPEHRHNGVATQVIGVAITSSPKPIVVTVKGSEVGFYKKFGFTLTDKKRGQYVDMVK